MLNVRVEKYLDSDGGPPPNVFASIYAVDPETGRKQRDQSVRREPVPISMSPQDVRSVSLIPGHYVVEVTLPDGDVLSDQVHVSSDQDVNLVLKAEDSPHEWLGWQHLMGNVSTIPTQSRPLPPRHPATRTEPRALEVKKKGPLRKKAQEKSQSVGMGSEGDLIREMAIPEVPPKRAARDAFRLVVPGIPDVPPQPPSALEFLTLPLPGLAAAPGDAWTSLTEVLRTGAPLTDALNTGHSRLAIPVHMQESGRAVYRVVHGAFGPSGATPLNSTFLRDFVVVPIDASVDLVCLPTPWNVINTGREAVVEIVVQRNNTATGFSTSITVRDERLGVLLGYLSAGALNAVREIAETARDMLYGKTTNALAAAAGGYAMIGTATDTNTHEWHAWIENLCNWFPHIPDGAIQLAQLHLRLRRGPDDLNKALQWFKEAYRRGLPFYSLGIRWLLDGLEKVGRSDPEAEVMRTGVQSLAWRMNPGSAFTVLHLMRR